MKKFSALSLSILCLWLLSACNKKQQSTYKDAKIYGLASPIQLTGDTTRVILSDYFPEPVIIDSITNDIGLKTSTVDDFMFLVSTAETTAPIGNLTIFAEGIPYSLLIKNKKTKKTSIVVADKEFGKLSIKGEFSNWALLPMQKAQNEWKRDFNLKPGKYAYKLVADSTEINHEGVATVSNGMGGQNNVLVVPKDSNVPLPYLTTHSFTKTEVVLVGKNINGIYAYWNNFRVETKIDGDTIRAMIPPFAKYEPRSHLRIYGYNAFKMSNDVLVPLAKGKVVTDSKKLNNNDWHSSIMYFTLVDRFNDGDSSNNKPVNDPRILPKAQYYGGDIKGITQKIKDGYFSELGINTIWISPITQNPLGAWGQFKDPDTKFSGYHGYWPITSTTVDFRLGNPADVREMLHTAHTNGISVILDYVANHVHEEHSVYQQHKDWVTPLYLPDGRMNTELWDEHRLTTWFDTFLPTLNLMEQHVTEYMVDSAVFWVENYDFDGIRHDATKHIPLNFQRTLTQRLKEVAQKKGKYIYQIGETYGDYELTNSYIGSGLLDAQFDFNMYDKALPAFAQDNASLKELEDALQQSLNTYGYHHLMGNITGNQDKPRFASYADGSLSFDTPWLEYKRIGWKQNIQIQDTTAYRKMLLFNAYNMAIPGIPIIYYGDEIAMAGAGDPDNRRMMRFDGLNKHELELKKKIEKLIELRNNHMALLYGETQILNSTDKFIVIRRKYFDDVVTFFINKGPTYTSSKKYNKYGTIYEMDAEGYAVTIDVNGEIIKL
jgi:cyclomaltodextrinase